MRISKRVAVRSRIRTAWSEFTTEGTTGKQARNDGSDGLAQDVWISWETQGVCLSSVAMQEECETGDIHCHNWSRLTGHVDKVRYATSDTRKTKNLHEDQINLRAMTMSISRWPSVPKLIPSKKELAHITHYNVSVGYQTSWILRNW